MDDPNEKKVSLSDQVKAAERDKYLAEGRKADSERLKIDLEYSEAFKESQKRFWNKKATYANLIKLLVGLTVLGFYIEYVVVPISAIKNQEVTLENKKAALAIFEKQQQVHNDSVSLKKEKDSLKKMQDALQSGLFQNRRLGDSLLKTQKTLSQIITQMKIKSNLTKSQLLDVQKRLDRAKHELYMFDLADSLRLGSYLQKVYPGSEPVYIKFTYNGNPVEVEFGISDETDNANRFRGPAEYDAKTGEYKLLMNSGKYTVYGEPPYPARPYTLDKGFKFVIKVEPNDKIKHIVIPVAKATF